MWITEIHLSEISHFLIRIKNVDSVGMVPIAKEMSKSVRRKLENRVITGKKILKLTTPLQVYQR